MSDQTRLDRRQALKAIAITGVAGYAISRTGIAQAAACEGDGTPLQFIPKTKADPEPLKDELTKYPKCPYCGMDRKQYHHSRHLVHYADDLVDGTCSLHCAAISLAINLDRGPKAIYAADFGSTADPKPLVNVDQATYLIGSKLPGVMTAKSKKAFASGEAAAAAMKEHGGELGNFDAALAAAYASMAADTSMIRKKRAEKRAKAMEEKKN
jgi:nitrous oxide reductase accessory protein NosL